MDKFIDFVKDTATTVCSTALKLGAEVSKKVVALVRQGGKALAQKCPCAKGEKECPCTALLEKLRPAMKIVMLCTGAVALVSGLCFFLGKKK